MANHDEDIPYRSPVTDMLSGASPSKTTSDEVDYNTLKEVRGILKASIDELYKDFNAFQPNKDDLPFDRIKKLLHEIESKQMAYNILAPIYDSIITAMKTVDDNFKEN